MIEISPDLLQSAKQGNRQAKDKIAALFCASVENYARRYFLAGGDRNDLEQEGYIGLTKAIDGFDADKGAFVPFALKSINNSMLNGIKRDGALKRKSEKDALPIDFVDADGLRLSAESPETIYLQKESGGDLMRLMDEKLTPLEKNTVMLFVNGCDYKEIAGRLNKDVKSVDNALARARTKLAAALKEQQ
jgi:RNA polymerase sporulation-specific sigma factor